MVIFNRPLGVSLLAICSSTTLGAAHAGPYGPATIVPQATPTGSVCESTASSTPVSPLLLASAIAECADLKATGTNDTRNDILDGICKPFTLIFARGTGEDPNLGNIVGPPFVGAVENVFGASNVAVQGVNDYAASSLEFCEGGSSTASQNLIELIEQTMFQCPNTKLCISGYSQGAQVVHNAAQLLNPHATKFISSVILFGDPDVGFPVGKVPAYRVSTDCHEGDDICSRGTVIYGPHLSYCHDTIAEAKFAKSRHDMSWEGMEPPSW
ncbi:hypothetical protein LTR17_019494 [Elasticomyces elasticus]|nr:hypothetical protein LTR17_019494 [Elasticomyces elasticus]